MKHHLLTYLKSHFDTRLQMINEALQAAQSAANEETKSSAGDKYETARAMAQIERDRHAQLYEQIAQERAILERINPSTGFQRVGLGALVRSTAGIFFVAVSAGAVPMGDIEVIVVSPQSPLGTSLMGKQVGERFMFRQNENIIKQIE
ncbi:MAG: transcription elongation factor [Runella sp.]